MDVDASLTPPPSPSLLPDIESESSPVLIGKKFKRSRIEDSEDMEEGPPSGYSNIPAAECLPPIYGNLLDAEKSSENSLTASACLFFTLSQNTFPGNKSDSGLREVAGEVLCLYDLTVPDVCCDFFYQVEMRIQTIERLAMEWMSCSGAKSSKDSYLAKKCRRHVHESLLFVCEFVQTCEDDGDMTETLNNIFDLMLMICNLCESSVSERLDYIARISLESSSLRKRAVPVDEWVHCYADVHFAFLWIMPLLSKHESVKKHIDSSMVVYTNSVEVSDGDFCQKFIKKIYSLIMNIAAEKYAQTQRSCKGDRGSFLQTLLRKCSPFSCRCFQALPSLCFHTSVRLETNVQSEHNVCDSQILGHDKVFKNCGTLFWRMISIFVNDIVQGASKKSAVEIPKSAALKRFETSQDALSFCWWWTYDVARVFLFDPDGSLKTPSASTPSCVSLTARLLRMSLSSCDGNWELMTAHLAWYKSIISLWIGESVPSKQVFPQFTLLWSHFSKVLNAIKKSEGFGLHKYALKNDKSVTPKNWLARCDKCLGKDMPGNCEIGSDASDQFGAFLAIFGQLLSHGYWNDNKQKFFSRLQTGEMKKLNESGLTNLFQTFLLIASSKISNVERLEVFSKLAKVLDGVTLMKTDYRKMKVMLNGLFCCVQLSVQHSLRIEAIASKCASTAGSLFKLFSDAARNVEQRNSIWKLVEFYFRNLSEIFQASKSFQLGQELLLPSLDASTSLTATRANENVFIADNFSVMFSTLSSHLKRSHEKAAFHSHTSLVENLSNFVLPWLKAIVKSDDVAAEEIANLIVELCGAVVRITKMKPLLTFPIKMSSLVSHFCGSIDIKLGVRSALLLRVMSEDSSELIDHSTNQSVVQGALKCIVSHDDKERQDRLTRCILRVDAVQNILECRDCGRPNTFEHFLEALKIRFDFAQKPDQLRVRAQMNLWFSPISEVITSLTKSHSYEDPGALRNFYKTIGLIVQHCGKILYSPGSRGLVTQAFDVLILPRSVYVPKEKKLNPTLMKALYQSLHIFIKGLLNLDCGLDAYVQRVLRDIVNVYLTRFPAALNAPTHPFAQTLVSSDIDTAQKCSLLKTLCQHCQTGPDQETTLTVLIDVLQAWVSNSSTVLTAEGIFSLRPITDRAKVFLNAFPAMRKKIDYILTRCAS